MTKTLCSQCRESNPMNCSLLDSSVHGISQARILEWIAIFFPKGSSWPRDRTSVLGVANRLLHCRQILYHWATRRTEIMSLILFTFWYFCKFFVMSTLYFPLAVSSSIFYYHYVTLRALSNRTLKELCCGGASPILKKWRLELTFLRTQVGCIQSWLIPDISFHTRF